MNDIKEYFSFSKSQSRAMIALSILCLITIFIYVNMGAWISPSKPAAINDAEVERILASIYVDTSYYKQDTKPSKLTPFNF